MTLPSSSKKRPTQPKECGAAAELYSAPKPPSKGKIIGLDCHPDTFTAAVFQGSTPHDARQLALRDKLSLPALLAWAGKEFTKEDLFLMEAGSNSFEVYRRLLALGLRAVVLESAHVGKHAKSYADNDRMAAARIVRVFLANQAPCVWVPDALTSERRELLHIYHKTVGDQVAATNTLKSYLNQFGIRLGTRSLADKGTREWIFSRRAWSPLQGKLLTHYWEELVHQSERRNTLRILIAEAVCAEPLMLRCMKLLGIGLINAFALMAIIGDVRRFENPRKLAAYIGLNPGQRESGTGKRIQVGVGLRGRGDMRSLLVQGAQALLRTGRHTRLGKWGWKLFARKGSRNVAVAAVARKLVVQVWHLLSGNAPTGLETDKSLATKLQKLLVILGKKRREEMGLAPTLEACVLQLLARIGAASALTP